MSETIVRADKTMLALSIIFIIMGVTIASIAIFAVPVFIATIALFALGITLIGAACVFMFYKI